MRLRILLAAGALSATPGLAHADPFWLYDGSANAPTTFGQFYITGMVSGGVQQLPRFNSTTSLFNGTSVAFAGSFDPDLVGVEPGGAVGYVFRDGSFPSWIGRRARIEFSGNVLSMWSRDNGSFQGTAGQGVVVNGIGGTPHIAPATLAQSFRFDDSLRVERDGFRLRLKFAADHVYSPNLSITPSVAVHGGQISDSYRYTYVFVAPATGFTTGAPGSIDERLRTSELGLDLGAAANWQFMPGFALHLGGSAGVVWQRTRLSGQDCLNNNTALPLGLVCGPSNGSFTTTSVSDSRSSTGFRGTASLGLSADMRYAVASIGGFLRYDSRIPGVENPQSLILASALTPARVRFAGGIAYGAYVTFRISLATFGL